jgi:hypothetical protein
MESRLLSKSSLTAGAKAIMGNIHGTLLDAELPFVSAAYTPIRLETVGVCSKSRRVWRGVLLITLQLLLTRASETAFNMSG